MNARHLRAARFSRPDTLKVSLMDSMELLRLVGSVTTVVGAILVALNWSPRVTVAGFGIFIIASTAWMIDGWLEASRRFSSRMPSCSLLTSRGCTAGCHARSTAKHRAHDRHAS